MSIAVASGINLFYIVGAVVAGGLLVYLLLALINAEEL